MKTDSLFYRIFLEFPSVFFELIGKSPDEAEGYEFTSREVKQPSFRIDGLFLPLEEDSSQPFYLAEVQFQAEDNLYYRLFSEFFLLLKQYQPPFPWQIVVIYPSRSQEREKPLHFGGMLQLPEITRIYLNELGELAEESLGVKTVKLVIESEKTAVESAKKLIAQANQQITDEAIQRNLIDLIETIVVYKLPQKSRQEVEKMLGLGDLKQTRFYQEAFAEGQQEGRQEGEQIGEQRGRQEGEQRGRQEGEQKAKLEAIPELLKEGLSVQQIARILKLPLNVVEKTVNSEQ